MRDSPVRCYITANNGVLGNVSPRVAFRRGAGVLMIM